MTDTTVEDAGSAKPFRASRFIDFNTGRVHTPPMELQRLLPPREQQSIDQMLLLFECRVDVWKFGPAVEMLKTMDVAHDQTSVWAHAGYALLDVTCSYFEMIGKALNPTSRSSGTAGLDFNFGLCDVYPEFGTAEPTRPTPRFLSSRRFVIACGTGCTTSVTRRRTS